MRSPTVLLVSLPWTTLTEPSLGLGLLRAHLDRAAIPSRVAHLNIELLRWLRPETYVAVANMYALNDFLFTGVLEPDVSRPQWRILREKCEILLGTGAIAPSDVGGVDGLIDRLLVLRAETIPAWLARTAERIADSPVTLVGFTCMFDQTIASVALAKLIKERAPDKLLALGGYAVRPPTAEAVLRAFPWIDAIASGEGDNVIVPLARASAQLIDLGDVPGVVYRNDGQLRSSPLASPINMDHLPTPNFDDFLVDTAALNAEHHVRIELSELPLENSRGCWWGALHHCVFCGINDEDLPYRHRAADLVLRSLADLCERYGINRFRFSDYILPHEYYTTLLPRLADLGAPYKLTCELKANISPDRFRVLASAGFEAVQPGIESFSSPVLKRMNKGVSGTQNVLTLKLGKRAGVRVDYNILYGFPGDRAEEYEQMVRQLPRLRHLDPPASRVEVLITRFAPLQVDPGRFGIDSSSHARDYDLLFSESYLRESAFDLDDYCYYFTRPFENSAGTQQLFNALERVVDDWRAAHEDRHPRLTYRKTDDGIEVNDEREPAARTVWLDAEGAALLEACATPRLVRDIFVGHEAVLEQLRELGLVFEDDEHVVSLPLPEGDWIQSPARPALPVVATAAA